MQRRGTSPGTVRARSHAGARRRVRTVLAKPGVECSPDLPHGLRRVSESAPMRRRRVGRHRRRCSRPIRGGDSIYDKLLTGEPILPARTANQYLARFAVRAGNIGSPWKRCFNLKVGGTFLKGIPGYPLPEGKCLKFKKTIYGLKQAPIKLLSFVQRGIRQMRS